MHTQMGSSGRPEEIKRFARVLEMLHMIAMRPRKYRRRDLAQHFEVSERMIQKDLDVIRHRLRFDLAHTAEGYHFEKIPQLPALHYSLSEALSLLLAMQAAWQVPGIGSGELSAAVARLKSIFPSEFMPLLDKAMGQPVMAVCGEHRQQMLLLLHHALAKRCKVRMVYETRSRGGDTSERVVWPYHIKLHVRSWHMIAHCENRNAVRVFKVDRIREATLMDEGYAVPKDFDLMAYMGDAWGMMRGEAAEPVDVALRFEAEAGHWVAEEYWHHSQKVEELPDGKILFKVRVSPTPEFVNWLLYYGSRMEVLAPESLRKQVVEEHCRAVEVYESKRIKSNRPYKLLWSPIGNSDGGQSK